MYTTIIYPSIQKRIRKKQYSCDMFIYYMYVKTKSKIMLIKVFPCNMKSTIYFTYEWAFLALYTDFKAYYVFYDKQLLFFS